MTTRALRGRVLHFVDDPARAGREASHRYFEDGLIVIRDGRIAAAGDAAELLSSVDDGVPITDHRPHLIAPGFIDTHIHLSQTRVIASYGAQLLDWLEKYAFVEEQKFGEPGHAERMARFFIDQLLSSGTTSAVVYCSVHPGSADALFAESERRNARMIGGKVLMDRNAPPELLDTAERGYRESRDLIARWHGVGRQLYAVTPRFAVTSTPEQMEACGALLREHPDCYLQTHLAENEKEIETVKRLFPWARDYTHVYERYGLLGRKSLFGHCVYLSESELDRLHESGSVAAFCPTSNLFLGSGLFDLARTRERERPVRVGVATDVGGGTSYSMLRTLAEGYKVLQLQGQNLPALDAFYLMTLGNARALDLEGVIGGFTPGCEADAVVLDARATPGMAHRMETVESLEDELFVLMTMGDERSVRTTYLMGEPAEKSA